MISDDPALSYWWDGIFVTIANDPALRPTHRSVLVNILQHVRQNHRDVTQQTVANGTGVCHRTVKRAVQWLVTNGYLLTEKQADKRGWRMASTYAPGPKCQRDIQSKGTPVSQQKEKLVSLVLKSVDQVQGCATFDKENNERTAPGLVREVPPAVRDEHPHPIHGDLGLGAREVPREAELNHPSQSPDPVLACRPAEEQSHQQSDPPTERATMPDRAIDRVLEQLTRVRRNGASHLASCPVISHGKGNGDREPSLSVGEHDGRVLLNCMSGCHTQDILTAIGMDWPDLFDEPISNERGVKVAEWVYQARDGSPYAIAERWQTPQGKKFLQRIPGAREAGLPKGFKPALYRLPEVLAAVEAGEPIWLCEGEKCCSAGDKLGVMTTTAPAGVNGWKNYFTDWLKGCSLVNIVVDNDEPGLRYGAQVAACLKGVNIPVKTWRVAVPGPKADLWDHVRAGYGLSDLVPIKLNQLRPEGTVSDKLLSAVYPQVSWAIPGMLPTGFALLGGSPKVGKSLVALDMALAVASGRDCLHQIETRQGSVLFLSLDNDSMRRTQARAWQFIQGRDIPSRGLPIEFHVEWPTGDAAIAACVEWATDERDEGRRPLMIVVDTLARVEPNFEGSSYENSYLASTAVLSRWSRMAEDQDVALLAIHHDRKSADEDWLNRFTGSRGITATAQTLMFLDAKRGAKEGKLRIAGRDIETDDLRIERDGIFWDSMDRPVIPTRYLHAVR